MFDNPEKLIILAVIALLIFGPSKLAGFGGALGRTIRDFRNSVRGAQEEARETFGAFTEEARGAAEEVHQALPAPDAFEASMTGGTHVTDAAPESGADAADHPQAAGARAAGPAAPEAELEDLSSLASEPSAEAVREIAQQAQRPR